MKNIFFSKSKIFLYLCLSFVLGVFVASFYEIPVLAVYFSVIVCISLISIFWCDKKAVLVCFFVISLSFGISRFQETKIKSEIADNPEILEQKVIFEGLIAEEPNIRIKDTQYAVQIKSLKTSNSKTRTDLGKVLVTASHYPAYKYGDLVEFSGKLKVPRKFDSFNYQEYLAKDGIYLIMYNPDTRFISSDKGNYIYSAIFGFKERFKDKLKLLVPEPEISLLNGLLLGEKSGMGDEMKNYFSLTGTSHIVAVSGFNVTIIAVIILELCLAIGLHRNQAFWISVFAILAFIIMVGAPASAIRAGIMAGLVMAAIRAGRLNSISNAIVFAATLMIFFNPMILRFDVGFQLSFLAVMGLVWVYPVLEKCFEKIPDIIKLKSMLLATISAQIMAIPVLIYNFDRLSIISPLANILILPFIPLAMVFGFLAGIISLIWIIPAKIIGYFTWMILAYQLATIEYLAKFSVSSVTMNFSVILFIVYYIIIILIIMYFRIKKVQLITAEPRD